MGRLLADLAKVTARPAEPNTVRPRQTPLQPAKGPITIQGDVDYRFSVDVGDAAHVITASFSPELAARLAAKGQQVDLSRAVIIDEGGEQPLVASRAQQEARARGEQVSPWLHHLRELEAVGDAPAALADALVVPTEVRFSIHSTASDGTFQLAMVPRLPTGTLQLCSAPRLTRTGAPFTPPEGPDAIAHALAPLGKEQAFLHQPVANGMQLTALTPQALRAGQQSIQRVLGHALRDWPARRAQAQAELAQIEALHHAVLEAPSEMARLARLQAVGIVLGMQQQPPALIQAFLLVRQKRLIETCADVVIVMVPAGKHWSAMPQCEGLDISPGDIREGSGGINRTQVFSDAQGRLRARRVVFMPEDAPSTQLHELTHVLEAMFMTDEQRATLDAAHAAAADNRGPFARAYGVQRSEYTTTMAELFFGDGGREGLRWLQQEAAPVFKVLCEATGSAPHLLSLRQGRG